MAWWTSAFRASGDMSVLSATVMKGPIILAAARLPDFRLVATYVDCILRGEKPGDLPVQFPTKFEMVVNRNPATALGLAVPPIHYAARRRDHRITAGYVGLWHCVTSNAGPHGGA
jgi:hypothetical protein